MKTSMRILLMVLLTGAFGIAQDRVVSRTSVRQHPNYAPYVLPALQRILAQSGVKRRNHFYFCKAEAFGDGYDHAWVYWKENRAIVLWEPLRGHNARGDADQSYDLVHSRRYLRQDKDVVPTLDDVGGSSFLVTRQWWRETVQDCVRNGERFVIEKRVRKRRRAQSNKALQLTGRLHASQVVFLQLRRAISIRAEGERLLEKDAIAPSAARLCWACGLKQLDQTYSLLQIYS